jgi:hypothetical protein
LGVLPLEAGRILPDASAPAGLAASLEGFRGTIRNDEEPYLIRADHGPIYRCRWSGGSTLWSSGDRVQVTRTLGMADMFKLASEVSAQVWVEELAW